LVEAIGGDARKEPAFAWLLELRDLPYTGSPPRADDAVPREAGDAGAARGARHRGAAQTSCSSAATRISTACRCGDRQAVARGRDHGIEAASVVRDEASLARARRLCDRAYAQPALAEEFIEDGRSTSASCTRRRPRGAAAAEIDYAGFPPDMPHIVSYAASGSRRARLVGDERNRGARSHERFSRAHRVRRARRVRSARSARYGRVDVRIDAHGEPS